MNVRHAMLRAELSYPLSTQGGLKVAGEIVVRRFAQTCDSCAWHWEPDDMPSMRADSYVVPDSGDAA